MNILWTSAGTWMLHTAIGGGILLLVTCVLLRWTPQPVRRQRLGDWGMTAALAVALCSGLAPSWLVIAWTRSEPAPQAEALMNEASLGQYLITEDVQVNDGALGELALLETPPPDLRRGLASRAFADEAPESPGWIEQTSVIVILVSAAIAGFFAIRLLLGYVALLRLLWRSETAPPEISGLFNSMAAGTRWVRLLVSRRLLVPLSCGLVRPTVVLPASMCQPAAPRQLRWIFAHELTHLRRRDAWSALLFNLGQVFFFAVPWFWWLRRQVRLCQEYVADAAAAREDEAHVDYAEFLLSLASAPAVPVGASAVSGNCSDLSRRVTMLLNDPAPVETRCPRLWTMLVAGGLASLAILVSGFGFRAEAAPDDQIVIIINTGGEQKKPEAKEVKMQVFTVDPTTGKVDTINKTAIPKGIDKAADTKLYIGQQIRGGGQYFLIQPDGDLAPLQNALKQLEQLQKEGKLTKERLEAELSKVVEQIKAKRIEGKVAEPKDGKAIRVFIDDGKGNAFVQSHLHLTPSAIYLSQKPRFGVNTEPISPAIAEHLKLPSNVGLLVTEVVGDTPAAKVGIKVNDVLVKIGGAMVPGNSEPFVKFVAGLKADTPLEVVVLRKGQTLTVGSVTLAGEATGPKDRLYKKEDEKKESGAEKLSKALTEQWKNVQQEAATNASQMYLSLHRHAMSLGEQEKMTIMVSRNGQTMTITKNEGAVTLTVNGIVKDGKVRVGTVEIKEGDNVRTYTSVGAVPEAHRARVEQLLETVGQHINVKMDKE